MIVFASTDKVILLFFEDSELWQCSHILSDREFENIQFQAFLSCEYTQSISNGSINIEGFERDPFSFFGIWMEPNVCILWSLSASFTMITRRSSTIATSIFRRLSIVLSSPRYLIAESLESHSHMSPTSCPNRSSIACLSKLVSSMTS